jgi:hypothetical protein
MADLPKAAQGTFEELLAGVEPDLAAIARRLRAMIRAVDVSAVETVLTDPERLLEGTGKGLRHVKIRSLAEANRPSVRALMAAALARRRSGATGPAHASSPRVASRGRRVGSRTAPSDSGS